MLTGAVIVDKPVDIEAVPLPPDYPVAEAAAAAVPDSHDTATKVSPDAVRLMLEFV